MLGRGQTLSFVKNCANIISWKDYSFIIQLFWCPALSLIFHLLLFMSFFFHFASFNTYNLTANSLSLCAPPSISGRILSLLSVSHSVLSNSLQPHGLQPPRLLCPWDSPGKNTGVGCHFLLQGIFLTQGLNPGLLQCRQILYHLSHQGSPESVVGT